MPRILISISLLLMLTFSACGQGVQGKDKVLSKEVIAGRVGGFEIGDYYHVKIKTARVTKAFFILDPRLLSFLAKHGHDRGRFTIATVDTYIPEAGGRDKVERIVDARYGNESLASWWKKERKNHSAASIEARYRPIVDKMAGKG